MGFFIPYNAISNGVCILESYKNGDHCEFSKQLIERQNSTVLFDLIEMPD